MSLLFSESPIIGIASLSAPIIGVYLKSNFITGVGMVLLLFLLYFYRYTSFEIDDVPDNYILSPCEGTVLNILDKHDYYYVPIFLSPFNRHTQIYPANCTVINRVYDYTGEFNMVMNLSKSKNNEKKIHTLKLNNGATMQLTQISGFLPRMITSSEDLTEYKAGDYLGMIKFGSRIDLLIPKKAPDGSKLYLSIGKKDAVRIGDYIGKYS